MKNHPGEGDTVMIRHHRGDPLLVVMTRHLELDHAMIYPHHEGETTHAHHRLPVVDIHPLLAEIAHRNGLFLGGEDQTTSLALSVDATALSRGRRHQGGDTMTSAVRHEGEVGMTRPYAESGTTHLQEEVEMTIHRPEGGSRFEARLSCNKGKVNYDTKDDVYILRYFTSGCSQIVLYLSSKFAVFIVYFALFRFLLYLFVPILQRE